MIYVCFFDNSKLNLRRIKKTILFLRQFQFLLIPNSPNAIRRPSGRLHRSFRLYHPNNRRPPVLFVNATKKPLRCGEVFHHKRQLP